ncbi:oligosaccharide flippase family protein [Cryobacterium luteum]|uniref:oligosaccharide flippase family protein n=1 Tax=Cryobacterium luteum TaxID=1424661 RepID=UPI00141AACAE|nr:oligosaccharide flippase family protein [Cryobacterium luteum]
MADEGPDDRQRRPLSHGVSWSFVNTLVTKIAGMIITIFVVRIVSPYDFGVFAVALVVYVIVSALCELGLSSCIARRDVELADAASVVTALSMLSSFTLATAMFFASAPIAAALGAPEAQTAIQILAIPILLSSFTAVSSAILVRDYRQGRLFAATAIAFIPSNAVLIILALHGDGALAFAWSRVVGVVIAGAVVISGTRPWYAPRWNSVQAARVLKFGLPLAGANFLNYMLLNADAAFIAALAGPALLGIYTLAFSIASWSTSILGGTINSVAMPAFSALRRDPEQLSAALLRWSRMLALAALPVSALTVALSAEIVEVLYGAKWSAAAPVLAILAVYGGIFVVTLLLSNLLVGIGRTGRVFLIQAVWLLALLPAIAAGVAVLGVLGAAIAHVVVIVVVVIPMYLWALKPVLDSVPLVLGRAVGAPVLAASLAAGTAYLAVASLEGHLLRLVVGGTLGLAVYLVAALPMMRSYLPAGVLARLSLYLAFHGWVLRGLQGKWAKS